MKNESVRALLQVCNQIGPDDFEMRLHSRTFSKSATLEEIEEWAKKYGSYSILNIKFATNNMTLENVQKMAFELADHACCGLYSEKDIKEFIEAWRKDNDC